jgi:hypothetical protein
MGLFDGLFGGGKKKEKVQLGELGVWFNRRLESETQGILGQTKGVLDGINELVDKLAANVQALGDTESSDIDARYDKIVATAKPSYVKSMAAALECLKYGGESFEDVLDFAGRLKVGLDAIGKVNFGDGKFLPYAYQDEMRVIQGGCKRLLEAHERLEGILSSNEEMVSVSKLKGEYDRWVGLNDQAESIEGEIKSSEARVGASEARLAELNGEMDGLRGSGEYASLHELRDSLSSLESGEESVNTVIHSLLSPLKRGLRKYEKIMVEAATVKLIQSIQDNPVEAFLNADQAEFDALIGSFYDACATGVVNLKDPDRVLKKIESARSQLTDELRLRKRSLTEERDKTRAQLSSMTAALTEERLLNEKQALTQSIKAGKEGVGEARQRLSAVRGEADEVLSALKSELLELDVEVS